MNFALNKLVPLTFFAAVLTEFDLILNFVVGMIFVTFHNIYLLQILSFFDLDTSWMLQL